MIKRKNVVNPEVLAEADMRINEDNVKLTKKWEKLLLAENAPKLRNEDFGIVARLLENEHNWVSGQFKEMGTSLQESYVQTTGGVEPFLKILVPTVRRIYKSMSALDLVGVQAMSVPYGYVYGLRFHYAGDKEKTWLQPSGLDRAYDSDTDTSSDLTHMSYVLVFPKNVGNAATDVVYANVTVGNILAHKTLGNVGINASAKLSAQPTYIAGEIVYKEETSDFVKVMINRYTNVTTPTAIPAVADQVYFTTVAFTDLGEEGESATPIDGADEAKVYQYFWNEIGYRFILKNFTGRYTTSTGEMMGVYGAPAGTPEWKTIKMTMERIQVECKSRKLKIQYSDEMYQDLKAVQGMLVNEELMRVAEYEIANEINGDILERILTTATNGGSWVYGDYVGVGIAGTVATGGSPLTVASMADGRNEKEKFQTLATKIRKEANEIALYTRRGSGNFVVVTPNVLTALQALDFIPAGATAGEALVSGLSYVGMLQNLKIYVDTYNLFGQDYACVGYKGSSNYDAGIIYCPYIALMVKKTIDPSSMQEVIGYLCRDSIVHNIYGSSYYYRTITVDLSGSTIGGLS